MPNSVQSQVLDAVVALLSGPSIAAWRCRLEPFSKAQLPAINVVPDSEEAEYLDTDSLDLKHKFTVRYTAQACDEVDKAIDPLYVNGSKLLLADPSLGGLVIFTRYLGRKWEFERGELDTVVLVCTYEVQFSTSRSDPSASWA